MEGKKKKLQYKGGRLKMYRIEKEDIKKRTMIVHYTTCPACGVEIDDLEQSLTGNPIICSQCEAEIHVGPLCEDKKLEMKK